MWTQPPFQSVLLHLLLQANALNLLVLPVRSGQANATTQFSKRHRIVARRSEFLDKLVMPIDLSILRSIPEPESQQRPVLLALDLSALHHSRLSDPRYGGGSNSARNDIVLFPDLTLPARIKNDYSQPPPHHLNARVASLGNDRIPVFEHLHASYGQGLSPKDALWDFLEEGLDDDNLVPRDYEYPEDYADSQEGMNREDEQPYWYDPQREEEYEGRDNKISSPRGFRDKKNVFVSESWRPGGHVLSQQRLQEGFRNQEGRTKQDKNTGKPHRKDTAAHATVFGLSSWRPGGKRSQTISEIELQPMASRRSKKNLFFTKGWGPGGKPLLQGRKSLLPGGKPLSDKDDTESTKETQKEGTEQRKQPPWRHPKTMWGVPHLFGPYW